jgi:hypothetical protein
LTGLLIKKKITQDEVTGIHDSEVESENMRQDRNKSARVFMLDGDETARQVHEPRARKLARLLYFFKVFLNVAV